jgi:hypothetical protein
MKTYSPINKYFAWADSGPRPLLRFTQDRSWLTVEYREHLDATGDNWRWSLLCAQDLNDYKRPLELCNRITLMLAEQLKSARQDVNILMEDRK